MCVYLANWIVVFDIWVSGISFHHGTHVVAVLEIVNETFAVLLHVNLLQNRFLGQVEVAVYFFLQNLLFFAIVNI